MIDPSHSPEERLRALSGKRILLIGIGNPLRGDDRAGLELARRLKARGKRGVIEAGDTPENHLGPARSYRPEVILLADAVRLPPGSGPWSLLSREELLSFPSATHNSSPAVLMEFLEKETGSEVFLLGIDAGPRSWGAGMSSRMEKSLDALEERFCALLPNM